MTTPTPTPEPPYDGVKIPEHFRTVPFDALPNGIKQRIVDQIQAQPAN